MQKSQAEGTELIRSYFPLTGFPLLFRRLCTPGLCGPCLRYMLEVVAVTIITIIVIIAIIISVVVVEAATA